MPELSGKTKRRAMNLKHPKRSPNNRIKEEMEKGDKKHRRRTPVAFVGRCHVGCPHSCKLNSACPGGPYPQQSKWTAFFRLCTIYYMLYTIYYILYTIYYILYTIYTMYFILYTVSYTLNIPDQNTTPISIDR